MSNSSRQPRHVLPCNDRFPWCHTKDNATQDKDELTMLFLSNGRRNRMRRFPGVGSKRQILLDHSRRQYSNFTWLGVYTAEFAVWHHPVHVVIVEVCRQDYQQIGAYHHKLLTWMHTMINFIGCSCKKEREERRRRLFIFGFLPKDKTMDSVQVTQPNIKFNHSKIGVVKTTWNL